MTKQETRRPGIGPGNGGAHSEYEGAWCLNRPYRHQVATPRPGDVVFYRSNDYFAPVMATVVDVDVDTDRGHPCRHLADPWLLVRLAVTPPLPPSKRDVSGLAFPGTAPMRPHLVECREARLEGAAGWLPLDWERRYRPTHGQTGREG